MIDVKLPLRTAYYTLLKNNLTYNAVIIPVSTDIKKLADNAAPNYVVITSQSGTDSSTMSSFDSVEQIVIQVVSKARTRVDREIVDNIANQILTLVMPNPGGRPGLPVQAGIQVDCVTLSQDNNLDFVLNVNNSATRRILTFSQKVRQTASVYAPVSTNPLFHSPITNIDFADATHYLNSALNNTNYNLFLNNTHNFLVEGTDWQKQTGGGFQILIAGFNATLNSYTIFIILK